MGKLSFYVVMDVRVEYFVNKLISGYLVEDLTKVYCCEECSENRLCCVKAFKKGLRHVCEESISGMVESDATLSGEE